ncbi:MAG: beta-ketoacyl-[acyl-carrier-protein] synthase family protein [Elusimicrobiaceae bacterium]|nr:beta-ketoacyl-[acyl-carrier-protein] synthase family protein [Elusimicrobiaceae bacterium]
MKEGVVIAGSGALCACGTTAKGMLEGALSGRACFALPKDRVKSDYVDRFPVFQVPESIRLACPSDQSLSLHFFLTAAKEAFSQAGLTPDHLKKKRVGVIVGTSVDASFHCFDLYHHFKQGTVKEKDVEELKNYFATSATAKTISAYFGFTGPFQTIVTACASGTDAIGLAKNWIENDVCDAVLCGGTDEINVVPYDGFIRLLIAGKNRCKPFSKDREGINIGEGAAAMLMLSHTLTEEFAVVPKGYVLGYGNACDGYHPTAPDPSAKGLQKAISFALKEAQVAPQQLAFINAHATASPANDVAESVAFNTLLKGVPVWGSKGVTGHTLGAAGAIEAVLSLQALNEKILPPTIGFSVQDEQIGFSPTSVPSSFAKRVALSDSLAFGGCNSAVILGAEDFYA